MVQTSRSSAELASEPDLRSLMVVVSPESST